MRPVMAKRSVEMMKKADDAITRGTGKVFADLGYADAEERQTKLRLAHAINGVIARRRLNQAAAAKKLGINQPKVSALANYKLDGFSVERLMTFLTALDQDVEIVIKAKPRSRMAGRGFVGGGGRKSNAAGLGRPPEQPFEFRPPAQE